MHVLGLTGSIGMGKSTTADFFRRAGVPVHDADAVVHQAYSGALVPIIEAAFPGTTQDGKVIRSELAKRLTGPRGAANLQRLEALVHPVVREAEDIFRETHRAAGAPLIVLDIPLLFETNRQDAVDSVLVVTAPAEIQRERVMARPGMTDEKFKTILSRQIPDADKRARAHHIIDTSLGLDHAQAEVEGLVERILKGVQADGG
ncbi:MAG: dephospho-CoA kinase [Pseudomonadota bacterium]